MKTLDHPVAPEEVMALMDGELTAAEANLVSVHIEQCSECAALREQLRNTSQSLSEWTVPGIPSTLDRAIEAQLVAGARSSRPRPVRSGLTVRSWRTWAVAGGGAAFGAVTMLAFAFSIYYFDRARENEPVASVEPAPQTAQPAPPPGLAGAAPAFAQNDALQSAAPAQARAEMANSPLRADAPLIARTASLTVQVNNLDSARARLDAILARHHGYTAQLTISEDNSPRSLQASVRIPASELEPTVAEMRGLGTVERETQSGEEVTQQHADLAARLANAREEETRLQDILAHRTGKMDDVLAVEDKISETRGEIEQLEAEQQTLEHRVVYASVDVELDEQYEAKLGNPSASIPNQVHNSFVAGLRHAGSSLLGVVLFFEQIGPVLVVWLALLGIPGVLLWRRYRRVRRAMRM